MARKKPRRNLKFSNPRYAGTDRDNGHNVPVDEIVTSFWGYDAKSIDPQSAIPADTTKQNFSTFPRRYYVDIESTCRDCGEQFVFFAEEQKHWYEELGFYVDAGCVRCYGCRQVDQENRKHFQSYSELIVKSSFQDDELAKLIVHAIALYECGYIKNIHELRRLKNIATEQIPESEQLSQLLDLIGNHDEQKD